MKKMGFLALIFLFCSSLFALEEGRDSPVLNKPLQVPHNSVVKIFSYACPHCYKFDKNVTSKVMAKLPGVEFIPYHLKTKGVLGESASKIFAAMIVLDEQNEVSLLDDNSKFKKAKFALYKATHDNNDDFDSGKDKTRFLKSILGAADVSVDLYEKLLKTPRAQEILKIWDDSYDVAAISGVPAYVISGKYLINLSTAGSIDKMVLIIKELLAK